jgi:cysteinyl-tRNA synthetase
MSKSIGNIMRLHEALDRHGRDTLVLYLASGHYRQPIAYGEETLGAAAASVARIREAARQLVPGPSPQELRPLRERFFAALADDFRTPEALAAMWEWVREANRRGDGVGDGDLREMLAVLGLENLFETTSAPAEVEALATERSAARAEGDYARADALRARIEELGWSVRDTPAGGYDLTALE